MRWQDKFNFRAPAVLLVSLLLLTSCATQTTEKVSPPTPGARFAMTQLELSEARDRAVRGDTYAINKLVDYYMLYLGDEGQGILWLERLGDSGDIEARRSVLIFYGKHPTAENVKHLELLKARWDR